MTKEISEVACTMKIVVGKRLRRTNFRIAVRKNYLARTWLYMVSEAYDLTHQKEIKTTTGYHPIGQMMCYPLWDIKKLEEEIHKKYEYTRDKFRNIGRKHA